MMGSISSCQGMDVASGIIVTSKNLGPESFRLSRRMNKRVYRQHAERKGLALRGVINFIVMVILKRQMPSLCAMGYWISLLDDELLKAG